MGTHIIRLSRTAFTGLPPTMVRLQYGVPVCNTVASCGTKVHTSLVVDGSTDMVTFRLTGPEHGDTSMTYTT